MKKVLIKVVTRLKEKSTWAGLAMVASGMFGVAAADFAVYSNVLMSISGVLFMLLVEKKEEEK